MPKYVCLHHNDADGRCAGAIVYRKALQDEREFKFYEMDYAKPLPEIPDGAEVWMVDFSLKPDVVKGLQDRGCTIVWIDHHATAKDFSYGNVDGLRDFKEKNSAGCELTWRYCFPDEYMPMIVTMVGDFDKWAMKYEPYCKNVVLALDAENTDPVTGIWHDAFKDQAVVDKLNEKGKTLEQFRTNLCKEQCTKYGYETKFGGHAAFALNFAPWGSLKFGEFMDKYPVLIGYAFDGDKYTVSLYSKDVDVSKIAKANGGGGHKGAAGFTCDKLPFVRE